MKRVVELVLQKKELKNISERVVLAVIKENITKKIESLIKTERLKTKEFKQFVKIVRAQLRRQYGAFQNPKIDRKKLVKNKDYTALLKSHQSSKERLSQYEELYSRIFTITGKPKSIIDIGCGMNPLSYEYMQLKNVEYFALDISGYDLEVINEYFKQKKLRGDIRVFDAIRDKYDFKKNYDICFCFKLFEILETSKSHRLTEDVFKKLPAEWVIASFSTKTLSGAPMTKRRRVWFEVMLKRLKKSFTTIELQNELFYVIKKGL